MFKLKVHDILWGQTYSQAQLSSFARDIRKTLKYLRQDNQLFNHPLKLQMRKNWNPEFYHENISRLTKKMANYKSVFCRTHCILFGTEVNSNIEYRKDFQWLHSELLFLTYYTYEWIIFLQFLDPKVLFHSHINSFFESIFRIKTIQPRTTWIRDQLYVLYCKFSHLSNRFFDGFSSDSIFSIFWMNKKIYKKRYEIFICNNLIRTDNFLTIKRKNNIISIFQWFKNFFGSFFRRVEKIKKWILIFFEIFRSDDFINNLFHIEMVT